MSLYSFINSIWVSGLSVDNLSAIGFMTAVFNIFIGFTEGLTIGAISIISRFIGAKKKNDVNNMVWHVVFLAVIFAVIFSIIIFLFLKPILLLSGADSVIELTMRYGTILFSGDFIFYI